MRGLATTSGIPKILNKTFKEWQSGIFYGLDAFCDVQLVPYTARVENINAHRLYKLMATLNPNTWLRFSCKSRSYSPTFACSSATSVLDCLSLNSTEDSDV